MAALEFYRNIVQAMSTTHSNENIVLKGLHKKKELGDISQPEKTWFELAKEEVLKLYQCVKIGSLKWAPFTPRGSSDVVYSYIGTQS